MAAMNCAQIRADRKSTRLNSSHSSIPYAVFCLKKKTTPMLFALAFLPMFGIGGLTGLPLGLAPSDIHLHDTYYVIGHFHYVAAPGTIFALFAGVYYWFPKATGRKMNDMLGRIHFWGSFVCINIFFFTVSTPTEIYTLSLHDALPI